MDAKSYSDTTKNLPWPPYLIRKAKVKSGFTQYPQRGYAYATNLAVLCWESSPNYVVWYLALRTLAITSGKNYGHIRASSTRLDWR